jgi:hypothetical protein
MLDAGRLMITGCLNGPDIDLLALLIGLESSPALIGMNNGGQEDRLDIGVSKKLDDAASGSESIVDDMAGLYLGK